MKLNRLLACYVQRKKRYPQLALTYRRAIIKQIDNVERRHGCSLVAIPDGDKELKTLQSLACRGVPVPYRHRSLQELPVDEANRISENVFQLRLAGYSHREVMAILEIDAQWLQPTFQLVDYLQLGSKEIKVTEPKGRGYQLNEKG
ncbi:hypothetical protein IV54_GL001630 [Levilactobacillus paucivorans]|uniref:Uncharacterized protein n=1 Tax=Levilactobacillus paucivorans TaxID=616990 RepID=A0A0R2LRC1_9LACO|nr:hypothetical protein [Levilactobacillus paucivorans]KRO04111.1 hypothetical protein IV54_GL001630 [Levilactobacillus paucivorans]